MIVEHLTYDPLEDRYDTGDLHREPDQAGLRQGRREAQRSTSTTTSSPTPRSSATSSTELDTSDEVVVYAKLPRGFFIPTPVGDYNPDWAIAFKEGSGQAHLLRRRDQGLDVVPAAQGVENAKIECARKFFASLNEKADHGVKYDVVTDYTELMQLVAG